METFHGKFGDYSTVLLAAFLVGIAVGKEIQDIFHCRALRLSPLGQSQPGFHFWLKILELIRQFSLLPVVVSVVPILVMHRAVPMHSRCASSARMQHDETKVSISRQRVPGVRQSCPAPTALPPPRSRLA